MGRNVTLTDTLYRYLVDHSVREPEVLRELREETAKLPMAGMQIGADQGQFMGLLAKIMGAKRCIEVGVFTGYSALAVALALPPDGRIVACDVSEEWTAIAQRYWKKAGVAGKIDLRLAPALETLDELIALGDEGRYDFAFIDADKGGYLAYYERCLRLLRPGGLVAVDNTLWSGDVADSANTKPDTVSLRAFNDALHVDDRVDLAMLPLGDGLTLARKR
ncbi:MAG: class I SAM-dependent methyltransferase [Pseudomonadota bacterium]|nr:class I SAM-dependent methyltransferase [Pseudomonadota bacterium]